MKSVPEPPQSVSIVRCEPTPKGLALTALALALAWLTLQLAPVVLVLVLMLVGTLNPAVERLEKKKWKRGWSIGFVFAVLVVTALALTRLPSPRSSPKLLHW